jgi:hypothetical protein
MSALPSQLTLTQANSLAGVLRRSEPAKTRRIQPRLILYAIGEQVRALFLAQRPPIGQRNSAWAAEDDYARFSNRSC